MAFFRSLRNSLHLGKSADDSSLVSSTRPEKDNINFCRNVTKSRSESNLSRGNTFILTNENAQDTISSDQDTITSNPHHSSSGGTHKPTSATPFDSSTFRRTKDRMQSDSEKSDDGTLRKERMKSNRTHHKKHQYQSSKTESEKYHSVTINDFPNSFREKLLNRLKAPHNPTWFAEVDEQKWVEVKEVRSHHEEPSKCSIVRRNEAFHVQSSSTSAQPHHNEASASSTKSSGGGSPNPS